MTHTEEINEEALRKLVNDSGFPFQMRVEREVRAHEREHNWHVEASEHAWTNSRQGTGGFTDIILKKYDSPEATLWMVIECKRTRADGWVFLGQRESRGEVYTLANHRGNECPVWHEMDSYQDYLYCPESEYCAVLCRNSRFCQPLSTSCN